MRDIAVVILNYIQFSNIILGINQLIELGYDVDIYCQQSDLDTAGFNDMFNDISEILKNKKYNLYREPLPNMHYKVLLEPYPSMDISATYKIKYRYSNISAKPNIVYKPENYIMYDAVLCSGDYDSNYLSVFTKTYKTANMKYEGFKKSSTRKSNKKQLLYLPTYGAESSIEQVVDVLDKLREDYHIVAKIHHGTQFLKTEHNRISGLKDKVDEFYDSHTELTELLKTTDVILTDNSGSIFEGIYTEIPVAVFCDDINKNRLDEFNSTQFELYSQGILPYTNNIDEIPQIIEEAQSDEIKMRQREWNREYFYHPDNVTEDFVNVIVSYLNETFEKRYYQMHSVLKKNFFSHIRELNELNYQLSHLQGNISNEIYTSNTLKKQVAELEQTLLTEKNNNNSLKEQLANLNLEKEELKDNNISLSRQLDYYNKGILYRIARKIYKIKNGD